MKKIIFCLLSFFLSTTFAGPKAEPTTSSPAYQALLKKIDALIGEQKFQAAMDEAKQGAPSITEPLDQAKLLTKILQLETGLHDYETAVKDFRSAKWPMEIRARSLLSIFYAHSLQQYAQNYSWEIRQRTKTQSTQAKDLKTWTVEEIFADAIVTLSTMWPLRDQLNEMSKQTLGDYINPNSFPEGVRDSLREVYSMLFIKILNDSSGWSPEQTNELFRLNYQDLLNGKVATNIDFRSGKRHPLEKIGSILYDLKSWHDKAGRKDASLDVQLEWFKVLHQRFTNDKDRASLRTKLAELIKTYEGTSWYSMGAGQLAEFWLQDSSPDSLVKARAIAQKGADAFPASLGAKRCRDLIHQIETPNIDLQGMSVDGFNRKSLGLNYKNIKKIYFSAYKWDFKKFLTESKDYNHYPSYRDFQDLSAPNSKVKPDYTWNLDLPETTDYREHKIFVTPPVKDPGFYIFTASTGPDLSNKQFLVRGVMSFISDLVISHRLDKGKVIFELRHGNSGDLIPGVSLQIYRFDYSSKHKVEAVLTTDSEGRAIFVPHTEKDRYGQYGVFAELKEHRSFAEFNVWSYNESQDLTVRSVVYADRAIYRPQQKIKWKAIFYKATSEPGVFKVQANSQQTVTLNDLNYQVIETKKVTTDAFGSAWGEFEIPTGRALGAWTISATNGQRMVRVEEYKRPTFELTWKDQKSQLRLNQKAEVVGEAKYYFGAPLTSGRVRYTVERSVVFPSWCYWGFFDFAPLQRPQVIATSSTDIGADGSFKVSFTPEADERVSGAIKDIRYNYKIAVEVLDDGGETRTAEKIVPVGLRAVEASLSLSAQVGTENSPISVNLKRNLLSGDPSPGDGVWRLVKLKEPAQVLMPVDQPVPSYLKSLKADGLKIGDDQKQNRWTPSYNWQAIVKDWPEESTIQSSKVSTDPKGVAAIVLPILKAGAYRLSYETSDSFGTKSETQTEFFVASDSYRPALPGLFMLSKQQAKVGEEISIWLPSGLKNQTYEFEVFQDGKSIEKRILNSNKNPAMIRWPIKENMRGGLGFTFRLLNDYQEIDLSQSLFVPWDNKEINVEFLSIRDRLLPGQDETWTIKLKGPNNSKLADASTQILAYMYDRSLDALAPHDSPSLLSIYPNRSSYNFLATALGTAPIASFNSYYYRGTNEYSAPREDSPIFLGAYGIGGPGMRGNYGHMRAMEAAPATPDSMAESRAVAPAKMMMSKAKGDALEEDKKTRSEPAEGAAGSAQAQGSNLRSNFSETSFFYPDLKNNGKGEVEIKFKIPDSVTSWNFWLQGLTQDLKVVTANKQTETVKELMIRPYLPRFMREGDKAQLRFVVNNTGTKPLSGKINIDLLEEDEKTSANLKYKVLSQSLKNISFNIESTKSFTHVVELTTPPGLGKLVVKATATAGNLTDGEVRSLPVLPGRFHLAQSKFVTLKDTDSKTLEFPDLKTNKDASLVNEKLVVQVDAQLFYSVLSALPYLVNYPYECVEQTLNRFISTGIMTSLFKQYPSIEKMAKDFSARKTQFESFDGQDANRRMALEETPWLNEAKGGREASDNLVNILDSRIATENRSESLSKLEKAQTSLGGFPWFSGGPPSPYMTLYVVYGFSKAMEFGVDVPKPLIQKAWSYLHLHYLDEVVRTCMVHESCWELITFLNYVISNYPTSGYGQEIFTEAERKTMLDFSFKHWKEHSPYLKGYLSLTLKRAQRDADSKLVWDSVMDSAQYNQEEGTHWAREDRSWLWYNDTIETHAFALRTLLELNSDNTKRDGIVQWLFLNKKLNHWESTRATSEVIYSLAKYLAKVNQLGVREAVNIKVGNLKETEMEFLPEKYTGKKNQIVFENEKVNADLMPVRLKKTTPGFMFASANWQFSTEKLPAASVGDFLSVDRKYFLRDKSKKEVILKPISEGQEIHVGDEIEVQLSLRSNHHVGFVQLRDPRGAGFEPVEGTSRHKWDLGLYWYEEIRDSGTNFFFENLPQGEYTFKYHLRATTAGDFKVSPATVQPMYATEFAAYSSGIRLKIGKE